MPVWWGNFIYSIFVASMGMLLYKNKKATQYGSVASSEEIDTKSIGLFFALATFALAAFFVGQRSFIFDTFQYQYAYDNYYTGDLNQINDIFDGTLKEKGPLYTILLIVFKHFTQGTFTDWFTFLAIVQLVSVALFLYRYSVNYIFSVFLFITTGCLMWTVNGIRQFLAVTFVLYFVSWIKNRKFVPFLVVVIIAYYIHSTAILWIPIYFLINLKPWSFSFIALSVLFTIGLLMLSKSAYLNDTEYSYLSTETNESGVNPLRILFMAIPSLLAFVKRKKIENIATRFENMWINLSVITTCCYIVGMFSTGVVGRIPIYFQMFSYVSVPWMVKNTFKKEEQKVVIAALVMLFFAYFCYDMYVAKNGIYNSSTLNLHFAGR